MKIYMTEKAAAIRSWRDAGPTAEEDSQPLTAAETLSIFFRAHSRIEPDQETELGALRLMNRANRERWGQ